MRALTSLVGFFLLSSVTLASPQTDQAAVLKGVEPIHFSGSVGTLLLYGETAFPIAEGQKNDIRFPVAAAARLGKGRLAAFGHESAMSGSFDANETLMKNLLAWLSGFEKKTGQPKIAVHSNRKFADALKHRKIDFVNLTTQNWRSSLSQADLIVANVGAMTDKEAADLAGYVEQGGGLLCGFPGWAWSAYIAKQKGAVLKDECPANHLFQQAGIVWTTNSVALPNNQATVSTTESLLETNVSQLLDAIEDEKRSKTLPPQTVASGLLQIGGSLPSNDQVLVPRLKKMLAKSKSKLTAPSTKKPIKPTETQAYLGCLLDGVYAASAPAEQLMPSDLAIPAIGQFPRAARRQTLTATLDTSRPGRHGFGAYAPPGEVVSVTLPPEAIKAGLKVRIGAHSDKLWNKESWSRPPQLDRVYPVTSSKTLAANAYGGLVYLEAPKNCAVKSVSIQVENVIAAPYYKHGETDPGDWRSSIRDFPGPWAELETDKVVLTLPAEMIRGLDFPDKLMEHWIAVLDSCADLAGISRDRARAERILADVQPSAGWMHSGYPIVTNMKASAPMGDFNEMLSQGNWGYYHELGHNHQKKEWTFDGTGEVTCNLFGLYAFDTIHKGKANHRFSDMTKSYEDARKHIAAGAPYDTWKSKPFLALTMYEQMKSEFGWEPFKTIFAAYAKMPANQKPKTDLERRDQWMVRFSREVGRDLGPFFETWGVPTTEAARKSIAELPDWLPTSLQ